MGIPQVECVVVEIHRKVLNDYLFLFGFKKHKNKQKNTTQKNETDREEGKGKEGKERKRAEAPTPLVGAEAPTPSSWSSNLGF